MPSVPKPTRSQRQRVKAKRKQKTPRQKLIKALDAIVKEIVFERDAQAVPLVYRDLIDEETGQPRQMKTDVEHPGHIITRARISVRWDLRNVHRQNAAHNFLHEYYPEVYNQWYIKTFGLESWNELVNDSKLVSSYSTAELETLLFNLTEVQKMKKRYPVYYPQKKLIEEDFFQKIFGL